MSEQTARNKPAPAPSLVSRLFRLLVLLLLIGSGAAGYIYVWPEVAAFQAKQAEVEQNLASLAKADQALASDLTALIDTKVKMSENATSAAIQSATTRLSAELDSIRDIEQRAAGKLNEANQLLYRMSKIDQSTWRRAEAAFNIRLAGQRLQFAGDVRGALTLLSQADVLLKSDSGDDVGAIRSAIAFDRTQLRAVEKLDMVGLMGRLSALDRQIQTLDLSALDPSVRETGSDAISPIEAGETSADTSVSLTLWEQAIDTLASYFVITELESPQQKPSTSDWSRFAALSIKLNLEQARVALLIRDSESFKDSLVRAEVILAELPSSNNDPSVGAVIDELAALSSLSLSLELPGLETLKLINGEHVDGADATNSSVLLSTDFGDNAPASVPE